ncbi:MAG: 3D domain-containing protein [Acidobacteriaceae bacterium]|nr:3D domain-containing protein [Acidobacteriaceae bacterium]
MIRVRLLVGLYVGCALAQTPSRNLNGGYIATAYSQPGLTASGVSTHRHVVAADPDVLPIGTRIKIKHAGRYSGEYVVADSGQKIEGRKLDIFIPNAAACRKFGKKRVRVTVIELGRGTQQSAKQADTQVKQDVKQELETKAVGKAANEDDWAVKRAAEKKGAPPELANSVAAGTAAQSSKKPPK